MVTIVRKLTDIFNVWKCKKEKGKTFEKCTLYDDDMILSGKDKNTIKMWGGG